MPDEQQPHASHDHRNQFEFARAGVRRCLARLRCSDAQALHSDDIFDAALEICTFGAGYVAAISVEPRPALNKAEDEYFSLSAHQSLEAETWAAMDFARLISEFIADTAEWLDLPELTASVPLLRAALFVQARQHFGSDCDFNPTLIQYWCSCLDTALRRGEPVEAILHLCAMRDQFRTGRQAVSDQEASGRHAIQVGALLEHDPGRSIDNSDEAQPDEDTLVSITDKTGAVEGKDMLPEYESNPRFVGEISSKIAEEALVRLSRQQADLLISPEPDPLRFAQVARLLCWTHDRIISTKQSNIAMRRDRLRLVPPAK